MDRADTADSADIGGSAETPDTRDAPAAVDRGDSEDTGYIAESTVGIGWGCEGRSDCGEV